MPIFAAVQFMYLFARSTERDAKDIDDGRRKPNRKRGIQHSKKRLPLDLHRDEWIEPRQDTARAIGASRRKALAGVVEK